MESTTVSTAIKNGPTLVLLLVLTISSRSAAQEFNPASSSGDNSCASRVERAKDCWRWHGRLPSCIVGKSSLVKCAKIELDHMRECDPESRKTVTDRIEMFARTDVLLCQEKELFEAFNNSERCWTEARNCAHYITNMTNDAANPELCKVTRSTIDRCIEAQASDPECHSKVVQYTGVLVDSTPCRASLAPTPLAPSACLVLLTAAILVQVALKKP